MPAFSPSRDRELVQPVGYRLEREAARTELMDPSDDGRFGGVGLEGASIDREPFAVGNAAGSLAPASLGGEGCLRASADDRPLVFGDRVQHRAQELSLGT